MQPEDRTHRRRRLFVVAWIGLIAVAAVGTGCGGGKKQPDENAFLTPEERYSRAIELLSRRELRQSLTEFGRVDQYSAEDRSKLEPLVRLGMADATFYQLSDLSLIDARAMYLDFVTLYGDHALAPYAQFQAGICSLRQVNDPSRDQAETIQALDDLKQVERRFPDSSYASASRVMQRFAEESLAEHDFLVGRFYLNRKKPLAAIERFRSIIDQFPTYRQRDKVYLYLGRALLASENPTEAQLYLSKLVSDYPDGRYVEEATKLIREGGIRLDVEGTP